MASTRLVQRIGAPRDRVYRALIDPADVRRWMVPPGMTSHVHAYDAREGGEFRISLEYDEAGKGAGKTTADADTYRGRFARLVPGRTVVQRIEFETADPAMQGEMTVAMTLGDAPGGGTELIALHDDLPPGLSPSDNELGWRLSLGQLAAMLEAERAPGGEGATGTARDGTSRARSEGSQPNRSADS